MYEGVTAVSLPPQQRIWATLRVQAQARGERGALARGERGAQARGEIGAQARGRKGRCRLTVTEAN